MVGSLLGDEGKRRVNTQQVIQEQVEVQPVRRVFGEYDDETNDGGLEKVDSKKLGHSSRIPEVDRTDFALSVGRPIKVAQAHGDSAVGKNAPLSRPGPKPVFLSAAEDEDEFAEDEEEVLIPSSVGMGHLQPVRILKQVSNANQCCEVYLSSA